MTLGEHPDKVDPRFRLSLDRFCNSEFDIGKFRDIGHLVGVNRFNQAGGAIMDDFDNDGLLDLVVTCCDPTEPMAFYRNKGDGTFEDRTEAAGLTGQLGGLYCVQTDYNNDGHMDIFIPRGAWLPYPMRPSLLRNNGDGTFTDVTRGGRAARPGQLHRRRLGRLRQRRLARPVRLLRAASPTACIATRATAPSRRSPPGPACRATAAFCKGAAWIDYDNDGYPDLFLNNLNGDRPAVPQQPRRHLHRRHRRRWASTGRTTGFSCWAWDYDNDGWLDIFATCYDRTLDDVVKGLHGPAARPAVQQALPQPARARASRT